MLRTRELFSRASIIERLGEMHTMSACKHITTLWIVKGIAESMLAELAFRELKERSSRNYYLLSCPYDRMFLMD